MSILIFDRKTRQIALARKVANKEWHVVFKWPAHNDVTTSSNGIWPEGQYIWAGYNAHPEMGLAPACHHEKYGCEGTQVFSSPQLGRKGLAVHAGRTLGQHDALGWNTLGCIRVPPNAMREINRTHQFDRLEAIVIKDDVSVRKQ